MVIRERNKRAGLGKLREIVQRVNDPQRGIPGSATFATYKIYKRPEAFRMVHAGTSPRLLVRTDEAGREYRQLVHGMMPRFHDTGGFEANTETDVHDVLRTAGSMVREDQLRPKGLQDKASRLTRFIVHPTRPKDEVTGEGSIHFVNGVKNHVQIRYFGRHFDGVYAFAWKDGKLEKDVRYSTPIPSEVSGAQTLFDTLQRFVEEGLKSKQLKFREGHTTVRFLTWKDQQHKPEFYDLKEAWEEPAKKRAR